MDNISGKVHWVKYLSNFSGFDNGQSLRILVQRTSRHFPHTAQCMIIGKNKVSFCILLLLLIAIVLFDKISMMI